MIRRLLDIVLALTGLIILLPLLLAIIMVIIISSGLPVLYIQKRVGKDNCDFGLIKFRTMQLHADKEGLITFSAEDIRITKEGRFLRKYKLDELPQLFNVLKGEMSFVGPRPEVRKYVDLYNPEQQRVLSVRPGLTGPASLVYIQENESLEKYDDPEKAYIETIMPAKLELNLKYLKNRTVWSDLKIMMATIVGIIKLK